jgi:hydroxymethylglutaryl-CoA lyase
MSEHVRITEVGPRDGLQNEASVVEAADKIAFIDRLSAAHPAEIEITSFVSPRWVPQLADAREVATGIERREGVTYSALVPNLKGMEAALEADVDKVAVFTTVSETFCQRNINASVSESLTRFEPVLSLAGQSSVPVRAYISCAVACPYDGPMDPAAVRVLAGRLLDMGVDEIDLGETIGVAVPTDIERLIEGLEGLVGPREITLHLHDTRGTALACALRAVQLGVRSFDASCGGLGGCPYAPGAAGNLATEDLVYMLDGMGFETGVDLPAQFDATRYIAGVLDRPLAGRVFNADSRGSDPPPAPA